MITNQNYIKELEIDNINENINFNINFTNGAFVEILGNSNSLFLVELINNKTNQVIYTNTIGVNNWVRSNIKYYIDWKVKITNLDTEEIYVKNINLTNERVLISIESSALGDNIAWFPHIDEFRKKHNCEIIVSTFKNELFMDTFG